MNYYLECLGETLLERLQILHATYDDTGRIRQVMTDLFGVPERCLVCAAPLEWKKEPPNDVDPWFCSSCCPICNSEEDRAGCVIPEQPRVSGPGREKADRGRYLGRSGVHRWAVYQPSGGRS